MKGLNLIGVWSGGKRGGGGVIEVRGEGSERLVTYAG